MGDAKLTAPPIVMGQSSRAFAGLLPSFFDHAFGDNNLLDLGRAFVYAEKADVAAKAFYAIVWNLAPPAVDLPCTVSHSAHHFGRIHFAAGRVDGHVLSGIFATCS